MVLQSRGSWFAVRGSRFAVRGSLIAYVPVAASAVNNLRGKYAGSAVLLLFARGRKVHRMAEIRSFRDLDAWQCGIQLTVVVYALVKRLPDSERFGLVTQMRRA